MYRGIFTIGVAVIRGFSFAQGDALTDYSYINARSISAIIARCLTGLGPTGTNNGVLGGLYFNSSRISNSANCLASGHMIFPEPGTHTAGFINIQQCGLFSTAAEGVYTCTMMNSSMMNESVRFGIYFTGRSESLIYIPSFTIFHLSTQLLQ